MTQETSKPDFAVPYRLGEHPALEVFAPTTEQVAIMDTGHNRKARFPDNHAVGFVLYEPVKAALHLADPAIPPQPVLLPKYTCEVAQIFDAREHRVVRALRVTGPDLDFYRDEFGEYWRKAEPHD